LNVKGQDFRFLKGWIEADGLSTLLINTGVIGEPIFRPDISASEVAKAAGIDLMDLRKTRDRNRSVIFMSKGAVEVVRDLYTRGRFQGIISLGGEGNTAISTTAMQALPIGVPKLMVSTVASGNTKAYTGAKDIIMMPSIVDMSGLNRVSRRIYMNAAAAIAGMVKMMTDVELNDRPCIATTTFGLTAPCVNKVKEILDEAGYEVLVFHAVGTGGRSMEDLITDGSIKGVLDITTTELADELVGGVLSAGPHRLEAAGKVGIPQVVVPGALDMVNFWDLETVPDKFKGRRLHEHRSAVTLMRTTTAENEKLGKIIAQKLNRAKGSVTVVIPKKGFSAIDKEGQPFYDPEADTALAKTIKAKLNEKLDFIEMDNHINDESFAQAIASILLEKIR